MKTSKNHEYSNCSITAECVDKYISFATLCKNNILTASRTASRMSFQLFVSDFALVQRTLKARRFKRLNATFIQPIKLEFYFVARCRVNVGDQNIRVSMNMPPGYLGYENFGMGKGVSKGDMFAHKISCMNTVSDINCLFENQSYYFWVTVCLSCN